MFSLYKLMIREFNKICQYFQSINLKYEFQLLILIKIYYLIHPKIERNFKPRL